MSFDMWFYVAISAVAFLLPAFVSGELQCPDGEIDEDLINKHILPVVQKARELLQNGQQNNGPDGERLPEARDMEPLKWSCDLEKIAMDVTAHVYYDISEVPSAKRAHGKAEIYSWWHEMTDTDSEIGEMLKSFLNTINYEKLNDVSDNGIKYSGETTLENYANLVRASTTEIGCASISLFTIFFDVVATYCITNQAPLTAGEYISGPGYLKVEDSSMAPTTTTTTTTTYATTITTAITITTPKRAIITTTLKPTTSTTSTPSTSTTKRTLSTSPHTKKSTTCPTFSSRTPKTTKPMRLTTPCPTYSTTKGPKTTTPFLTLPPSARAKRKARANFTSLMKEKVLFPQAEPDDKGICPDDFMKNALRTRFLEMHNYRRALLALGKVRTRYGKYLPQAQNMLKLRYDCQLEEEAALYASQCPEGTSQASTRKGIGENFLRIRDDVGDFENAVNATISLWWKGARKFGALNHPKLLYSQHFGPRFFSFTQMAWATTRYIGCSIVKCSSSYVSVCRYQPRGGMHEELVYKPGSTCNDCVIGSKCIEELGLCD